MHYCRASCIMKEASIGATLQKLSSQELFQADEYIFHNALLINRIVNGWEFGLILNIIQYATGVYLIKYSKWQNSVFASPIQFSILLICLDTMQRILLLRQNTKLGSSLLALCEVFQLLFLLFSEQFGWQMLRCSHSLVGVVFTQRHEASPLTPPRNPLKRIPLLSKPMHLCPMHYTMKLLSSAVQQTPTSYRHYEILLINRVRFLTYNL